MRRTRWTGREMWALLDAQYLSAQPHPAPGAVGTRPRRGVIKTVRAAQRRGVNPHGADSGVR